MRVTIAGLGKIGLPLAVQFGVKGANVVGYDINAERCALINDKRNPLPSEPGLEERIPGLVVSGRLRPTTDPAAVEDSDVVVFIVPVDIDATQRPDFTMLDAAVDALAPHLKRGALVIVETTVPVGTTRNRVGGRISAATGMTLGADFTLAFSPERVSSGTVLLDLQRYPKIVGGVDEGSTQRAVNFYAQVLDAEILPVRDAETAEYSKLLETTYRDVNIALANEFARAGDALGVDTRAAIAAANTQPYSHIHAPGPGVGGHCIPVYPYFIGAPEVPAPPPLDVELASAARRINDGMGAYVAQETVKQMIGNGVQVKGAKVNVLGLTFKENCPDLRNSKVVDVIRELQSFGCVVHVHDPLGEPREAEHEYGISLTKWEALPECDAVIAAVAHKAYLDKPFGELTAKLKKGGVFTDVKSAYDPATVTSAGFKLWRL